MKKKISKVLFTVMFLFWGLSVWAQGPPPFDDNTQDANNGTGSGSGGSGSSRNDTPLDGGLSILLAAGAAYGVKKYKSRNKK